jgi:hypothetical protein
MSKPGDNIDLRKIGPKKPKKNPQNDAKFVNPKEVSNNNKPGKLTNNTDYNENIFVKKINAESDTKTESDNDTQNWHDAGKNINNVIIQDFGDGKYKTDFPDSNSDIKTNYVDVKLSHNDTYVIEVRDDNKFEESKTPENIEKFVEKLNNFVEDNQAKKVASDNTKTPIKELVGGKKRNTSKIHKKSKKHQIKYKRNTKKSKR